MKRRYVWREDLENTICCPGCGTNIDHYYKFVDFAVEAEDGFVRLEPEYCPECGQHLDWSETREYGVKEEHT